MCALPGATSKICDQPVRGFSIRPVHPCCEQIHTACSLSLSSPPKEAVVKHTQKSVPNDERDWEQPILHPNSKTKTMIIKQLRFMMNTNLLRKVSFHSSHRLLNRASRASQIDAEKAAASLFTEVLTPVETKIRLLSHLVP